MSSRATLMMTTVLMPMAMSARALRRIQLPFQFLDSRPIPPDNIPDMSYAIEIHLQLVNLPQYLMEARNLRVRNLNGIARPVVLLHDHRLALLRQVVQPRLDLLHQSVEMPRQRRQ